MVGRSPSYLIVCVTCQDPFFGDRLNLLLSQGYRAIYSFLVIVFDKVHTPHHATRRTMSVNEVKLKSASTKFQIKGSGPATSRTFVVGDEDHTLGNALRHVLIQNTDHVAFAGYAVPHPSIPSVNIRVQAKAPTTAVQALEDACDTLDQQCQIVLDLLEEKLPEVKKDRIAIDEKISAITLEEEEDEEEVDDGEDDADDQDDDPMEE